MATVTFLEPGTDATQDFSLFGNGTGTAGTGTVTSDTTHVHTGTRAIKIHNAATGDFAVAASGDGVVADAGSAISLWVYLSTVAPGTRTMLFEVTAAGFGTTLIAVGLDTDGKLVLSGNNATAVKGTTVLTANTWTRLSLGYVIVSTTNWSATLYLNGVSEATTSNAQGTLASTGTSDLVIGSDTSAATNFPSSGVIDVWIDDIFVDNRTDKSDPGAIQVTAKRPFANGTTNGFTTQIGSGGSGYGSGHAPQVNEQPLSQTNGWSMVGSGSAVTEEYNIEGVTVGDVNLTGASIKGVLGWVFAKAALAETGKIVVDGTQTNIALTTTAAAFLQASATPTSFPAGTGTDIGLVTSTTVTTVSLYEAGILIAYLPGSTTPIVPPDQPNPLPRPPSREYRTFLQGPSLSLQGQGAFYGASGQTVTFDWPNPRAKPFPIENRSFLGGVPLNLLGLDQFFGAPGQFPTYDWPNPARTSWRLADVWPNLQVTTLGTVPPIPITPLDWPNPRGKRYPYLGFEAFFVIDDNVPFTPVDFTLPRGKTFSNDLRSFLGSLGIQLTGQDSFFGLGGPTYDWPNPRGKAYSVDLRTFIAPLNLLAGLDTYFGAAGQVIAYDWPNPIGKRRQVPEVNFPNLLLTTTFVPPPLPFNNADWPNPLWKATARDLRSFVASLVLPLQSQDKFFGPAGLGPAYDYPNPRGKPYSADLRTFLQSLPIQLLGQDSFFTVGGPVYDYPNPIGKPRTDRPGAAFWTNLLVSTLYVTPPPPFFQTDWPLPLPWKRRVPEISLGNALLVIIGPAKPPVVIVPAVPPNCDPLTLELLNEIQFAVIEPPSFGATWPSGLWSASEVAGYLTLAQALFLKDTLAVAKRTTLPTIPNTTRHPLPTDWIATLRATWQGIDGTIGELVRASTWELDHLLHDWELTAPTAPLAYSDSETPSLEMQIAPASLIDGQIGLLYVAAGAVITTCQALSLPPDCLPAIKWKTLALMLGKHGRGQDPVRAAYCEQRYQEIVAGVRSLLEGFH